MKRIITVLIVFCLISGFSGCGTASASGSPDSSSDAVTESVPSPASGTENAASVSEADAKEESEPAWPEPLPVGSVIRFKTVDLDGNVVDSDDLFAEGKVTMINIWATWCGPCREELPDLGKLAGEFEAQDCRIIGICDDAVLKENAEAAKEILGEAGAGYLNLAPTYEMRGLFNLSVVPTSFFVDSEGKLLVPPIEGAFVEDYLPALEESLKQVGEYE